MYGAQVSGTVFRFGDFELDTTRFELRQSGTPVKLERQVFDVLAYLVENYERLVPKEELLDKVWGDRYVTEAALNGRVMSARKAIGDNGKEQRLIKTVHGRGYRFVGDVESTRPPTKDAGERRLHDRAPAFEAPPIQYARASDGVSIAYCVSGAGRPLVVLPDWIWSHIHSERRLPAVARWYRELAARWLLVRYDGRGEGLSDRLADDYSLQARVADLHAVVERFDEPVILFAHVSGTLTAIAYAAEHPDHVSHLILWCGYSRSSEFGRTPQLQALTQLLHTDWDMFVENIARARATGWSSRIDTEGFTRYLRDAAAPEYAAVAMDLLRTLDVGDLLSTVRTPALVVHCSGVAVPPVEASRRLAAELPDARLCLMDGTAPVPHLAEQAAALRAIEEFLEP